MNIDPYMPGPHEPAELVSGGAGQIEALIEMPRLSKGASLSVYILTSGTTELVEGETFLANSEETPAVMSSQGGGSTDIVLAAAVVTVATIALFSLRPVQELFIIPKGKRESVRQ